MPKNNKKHKKTTRNRFYIILIILGVVSYVVYLGIQVQAGNSLEMKNRAKEDERKSLLTNLAELKNKREQISPNAIVKEAIERLKMHLPQKYERGFLPDPREVLKDK